MTTIATRFAFTGATFLLLSLAALTDPRTGLARTDGRALSPPARALDAAQTSLTRYLLLTGTHRQPDGGMVWFTSSSQLDGRVHTNTQLSFSGEPFFGDTVSSVDDKAWFYNNGIAKELADDHNGTLDVPQFARGFQRSAAPVQLPTHSHDQQKAALGLEPDGSAPTNAMIRTSLGLSPDSSPPPNGIYLVTSLGEVTGGLYVQGDASEVLASADTVSRLQIYRIAQGPTVRTITIDPAANTTSVTIGSQTSVFSGTPRGVLYVVGDVSDLGGPDRNGGPILPALLDGQQLLIAATGDIVLQNDMVVQNFDQGNAVLGIFSSGGSVRIGNSAPDEMSLDAFVLALGTAGVFMVDDYGAIPARGTVHLRGGVVASYYGAFGTFTSQGAVHTGYGRDFRHDSRGWEPPWYPTVAPSTVDVPPVGSRSMLLLRPHPNPARGSVRIRYSLPHPGRVRLELFDVLGRRVATLVDAEQSAGEHEATWTGAGSPGRGTRPGLHLLALESGEERACVRVVLLD